ncbi:anti-sigma factor [Gaiella sp.]|uniref:anti-sigma factor n=1 Tax=Gaiella sp. TaxID=2663207 RepID=UPI0032632F2E
MDSELHELSAGYALDALESEERDAFERHLSGCAQCQEDVASFWEVAGALAVVADGSSPSPELRNRILADARAETQTVVSLDSRRRVFPVLAAVSAAAAAVVIGLGIYATSLNRDLDSTRSALTAQENAAAVLADPTATSVALQSGNGRLVVAGGGSAVLVLDNLPAAPTGKTYQAWIVDDQTPISAGTFEATDDRAIVPIPQAVPAGAVVAVTVEEAGGSISPTLPPLAASEPV